MRHEHYEDYMPAVAQSCSEQSREERETRLVVGHVPSPDAALGDGDAAARHPYQVSGADLTVARGKTVFMRRPLPMEVNIASFIKTGFAQCMDCFHAWQPGTTDRDAAGLRRCPKCYGRHRIKDFQPLGAD